MEDEAEDKDEGEDDEDADCFTELQSTSLVRKDARRAMKTVSQAYGTMKMVNGTLGMANELEDESDDIFGGGSAAEKSHMKKGMAVKDRNGKTLYHVGETLGSGGFGTVYEGTVIQDSLHRRSDGTKHALKVLHDVSKRADACTEALIQIRVHGLNPHPHLCSVQRVLFSKSHDGTDTASTGPPDEDGMRGELIVSMELGGDSLEGLIWSGTSKGPLFTLGEGRVQIRALRVAAQLASALHAMHTGTNALSARCFLHCDVKPENVLMSNDHMTVIDFGGTCEIRDERGAIWSTVRSAAYASPDLKKLVKKSMTRKNASRRKVSNLR